MNIMQTSYVKISCREDVHICSKNFAKKWNKIRMKQLGGGKHMDDNCFPRTLKFEMYAEIHIQRLFFDNKNNI
jgi:hypothetical protein